MDAAAIIVMLIVGAIAGWLASLVVGGPWGLLGYIVAGIIGGVGTIFGKHGVNIAQMAVGRASPGGEAVGVLNLDSEPSKEALDEVRGLAAITSAQVKSLVCSSTRLW